VHIASQGVSSDDGVGKVVDVETVSVPLVDEVLKALVFFFVQGSLTRKSVELVLAHFVL